MQYSSMYPRTLPMVSDILTQVPIEANLDALLKRVAYELPVIKFRAPFEDTRTDVTRSHPQLGHGPCPDQARAAR